MAERMLNRNFVSCTFSCLFYTMVFFLFFSGMSSYCMDFYGVSSMLAAAAATSFVAGDLVARILVGRRMNLIGKRRLSLTAAAIAVPVSMLYLIEGPFWTLFVIRVVHGFLYGAIASPVATMVTEALPESRRSEGIGYFMLSLSMGSAIGPFLCLWLQNNVSYHAVFMAGVLMQVLTFISILPVKDERKSYTEEEKAEMHSLKISNFIDRSAAPISLVCFVFFFSYGGVLTFLDPYAASIGLSEPATYFFIFISISTLLSRLFLCRIADVKGDNLALIPFFILFVAGMLIYANADSGFLLLLSGLMMGFNVAQFVAVGQAIAVRKAGKERYGVAISTFNVALDLAYVVGPMAQGALIGAAGYSADFTMMAGIALLSLLIYLIVHGIPEYFRKVSL